ncbi:hypothetical protein [Streptomyces sp. NPDC048496]|uniref:hypothetical protein n=1 Tax=Streptomyces sp. NPDC048496 TaxID=3365558 RepID=UPI00371D3D91
MWREQAWRASAALGEQWSTSEDGGPAGGGPDRGRRSRYSSQSSGPAPDDLGVPIAAVARRRAELLEQPAYGGPYARAAALMHTLGRC